MFENEEFLQLVKQQLRRRQQDTDYFVQLASFQEFTSQHLKSFLLWVVNTCCDWSSDRERNCLSNLWDAFFCGFDTKTIFNSVDNKQQKTLRILGVKIQIRLSEFNLWIFCLGHQVKDLALLRPQAKIREL